MSNERIDKVVENYCDIIEERAYEQAKLIHGREPTAEELSDELEGFREKFGSFYL